MTNILKKKIPALYLIVAAVLGSVASVIAVQQLGHKTPADTNPIPQNVPEADRSYKFSRLEGYKYVHPLYLDEPREESNRFAGIKARIVATIQKATSNNDVAAASVYLKDFTNDEWILVNPTQKYHPGSLFKLVTLITYFRMAEKDPSLFTRQWALPKTLAPAQSYTSAALQAGHTYSVKELLYHMIANNNNDAAVLLQQHINKEMFLHIFTDLQLPLPQSLPDTGYLTSTKEYSRFVSAIYESSYLPLPSSEAAISLLCQATFKEGIVAGLPAGTIVAHKHGEAGTPSQPELHETGIIYRNGEPYLLTIMTRGSDMKKQAALMAAVSSLVWEEMNRSN
jgi:beta-lactamase class A